jgi:carbohydrate diacid regulator
MWLLDEEGGVLLPEGQAGKWSLPSFLEPGVPVAFEARTYLAIDVIPPMVLCAETQGIVTHDTILLAGAMVQAMGRGEAPIASRYDVYRRVLREELTGPELEALANEHQIDLEHSRCAIILQVMQTENESALQQMEALVPRADGDLLVELDRHTLVLLKTMDQVEGFDELRQLGEAIQQMLQNETGHSCLVGIGEAKSSLKALGESYREARRAMEVGLTFQTDQGVFVFRQLVLERFLMDIPRELGARYHAIFFNRKTTRLFNEEMLHTIRMFFAKDLNLSDTARQLFIHRNTLVYRLDKVQRQTGLDLRRFDDAVTFKLVMHLGKSGKDKPKQLN